MCEKKTSVEPRCFTHREFAEDCPYCASVRGFRERRVLNAALQFVAAGRHYKGITVPGQMLDYLAALNSSVEELAGARIKGSPTK